MSEDYSKTPRVAALMDEWEGYYPHPMSAVDLAVQLEVDLLSAVKERNGIKAAWDKREPRLWEAERQRDEWIHKHAAMCDRCADVERQRDLLAEALRNARASLVARRSGTHHEQDHATDAIDAVLAGVKKEG